MSTPSFRLYSGPLSMFGAKAQIAALEKGLDCEVAMVPFDMDRLYEPKHPEVARINPKRQVPVLIHGDLEIFDSTQIFEYLEDLAQLPRLWPAEREARALARLTELQSDEVCFPHIIRLMGLQDRPDDPAAVAARNAASAFYARMEARIGRPGYLAGAYSFADIAFFMAQFFGDRMGVPIGPRFPALTDWRARVASRPAVSAVLAPMAAFLKSQGRKVPAWVPA
jgi:glutathione S-transferase